MPQIAMKIAMKHGMAQTRARPEHRPRMPRRRKPRTRYP